MAWQQRHKYFKFPGLPRSRTVSSVTLRYLANDMIASFRNLDWPHFVCILMIGAAERKYDTKRPIEPQVVYEPYRQSAKTQVLVRLVSVLGG